VKVKILNWTPLWVCSSAVRKCWASEGKSDTSEEMKRHVRGGCILTEAGDKDKALIERVGNKNKHSSTLEHLNYSFDIDSTSRALLQEKARHRIASISVQSSRYTIEKVLEGLGTIEECLVMTGDEDIDQLNIAHMTKLSELIKRRGKSLPRDISKYALVEAYKTSYVWTVNARSLQNFLSLRTDKSALWEIRDLANEIFNQLPEEHKYLFVDFIKEN
jgi:thymidylate synthase (FAD)